MNEKTIEEILDIAMISCPNNCKQGICIVYKNTVDEGTVLCPVCGGSGRIDYTNEMKAQAIKELIKAKLPKEIPIPSEPLSSLMAGELSGFNTAIAEIRKAIDES